MLWVLLLDAVILLGGIFVKYIARFVSATSGECIMKVFGLTCPGCGGTRCVYNFFKGNFAEAFEFNQFVFIMIFYVLILTILLNLRYVFGLQFAEKPVLYMVHPRALIIIAILFLIFGIARNVFILLG